MVVDRLAGGHRPRVYGIGKVLSVNNQSDPAVENAPEASSTIPELTESELISFAQTHAQEIARQYMSEAARIWRRADSFSTWATAAGGASIGVAITQLSVIRAALGTGGTRALLWTLATSVLAGLIAKYMGFSVGVGTAMADVTHKITKDYLQENEQLFIRFKKGSPKLVIKYLAQMLVVYKKEMRPAIPFLLRPTINAALQSSLTRSKQAASGQHRWFIWQLIAIHLQILCLIVAVAISAFAA
jgi:hypothetical protein